MPRKAKVIAVPIEQKEEEVASGDEVKTEAQEMTDIINEVKVEEPVSEPIVVLAPKVADQEEAPVPEPKPKAKARAKPRTKKPAELVEPVVEVEASLDEVVADVTLPDEPKVEQSGVPGLWETNVG